MSQQTELLTYLEHIKYVTSFDAYKNLGITQLATRLKELKKLGHDIRDEWIKHDDGRKDYKRYWLVV